MKLSSIILGGSFAVLVVVVLLLILGVNFHRPVPAQGAALYDPAREMAITGVVKTAEEFTCPVSEHEVGSHVLLQTANGDVQLHLAAARIMRSQKIVFVPGEKLSVVGSQVRLNGRNDLIVREITRGNETFMFRDRRGNLLMTQN